LWNLIDTLSKSKTGGPQPAFGPNKLDVVLVWKDDIPRAAGRARRWLTVYDWLVAFSAVTKELRPPVRFFLIDAAEARSASFGEDIFLRIPNLLPWARVYRRGSSSEHLLDLTASVLAAATSRFIPELGLSQLLRDLGITGQRSDLLTMRDALEGAIDDQDLAACSLWIGKLTEAGGRHTFSNLVGPLLLSEELARAGQADASNLVDEVGDNKGEASYLGKFCVLLRALRLISSKTELPTVVSSPLTHESIRADLFGRFSNIRFLLVDDDAHRGYAHLLASFMNGKHTAAKSAEGGMGGLSSKIKIDGKTHGFCSYTKPDILADWLECLSVGDELQQIGLHQPGKPESFDILFLDLRLFDAETGRTRQDDFLARLISIYERYPALQQNACLADIIADTERFLTAPDLPNSLNYLLLLPIMLSVADPSLPIVLFSSTHQRDLVERLACFPNVVTSFAKPILSGYTEDEEKPTKHVEKLRGAIVDALILHEKRVIWERLTRLSPGEAPIITLTKRRKSRGWPKDILGKLQVDQDGEEAYTCNLDLARVDHRLPDISSQRKTLSRLYVDYILKNRYPDFASIPYEFLEAASTPKPMLSDADWKDISVALYTKRDADARAIGGEEAVARWKRNYLAGALGNCRNRKAHGYGVESIDENANRAAAIVEFLFLLDFLECKEVDLEQRGEAEINSVPSPVHEQEWLKMKFPEVKWPDVRPGEMNFYASELTSMSAVDWPDFVLYAARQAQWLAPQFLHPETCLSLARWAAVLWK